MPEFLGSVFFGLDQMVEKVPFNWVVVSNIVYFHPYLGK